MAPVRFLRLRWREGLVSLLRYTVLQIANL